MSKQNKRAREQRTAYRLLRRSVIAELRFCGLTAHEGLTDTALVRLAASHPKRVAPGVTLHEAATAMGLQPPRPQAVRPRAKSPPGPAVSLPRRKHFKMNVSRAEHRRRTAVFYESRAWRELRYDIIAHYGARCMCCGAGKQAILQVDHIKPLATHWHLRLDAGNLQVLCRDCNLGKGASDDTDWRPTMSSAD